MLHDDRLDENGSVLIQPSSIAMDEDEVLRLQQESHMGLDHVWQERIVGIEADNELTCCSPHAAVE